MELRAEEDKGSAILAMFLRNKGNGSSTVAKKKKKEKKKKKKKKKLAVQGIIEVVR